MTKRSPIFVAAMALAGAQLITSDVAIAQQQIPSNVVCWNDRSTQSRWFAIWPAGRNVTIIGTEPMGSREGARFYTVTAPNGRRFELAPDSPSFRTPVRGRYTIVADTDNPRAFGSIQVCAR
jgi:hypothetical protein